MMIFSISSTKVRLPQQSLPSLGSREGDWCVVRVRCICAKNNSVNQGQIFGIQFRVCRQVHGQQYLAINQTMLRQIDQEQLLTQNPFPSFGLSPRGTKAELMRTISGINKQQQKSMGNIAERCSNLQYVIASIEVLVARVGERVQQLNTQKESQLLSSLRIKQYQFMVSELKGSLTKQAKKQQKLSQQLESERKKAEKYREEIFKLQTKNNSLNEKLNKVDQLLKDKSQQVQSLQQAILKLNHENEMEIRNRTKSTHSNNEDSAQSASYYKELEMHLEELEEELQTKVGSLENKNKQLLAQLTKVREELDEERSQGKMVKKQQEDMNIVKYQLQLKLKKETQLNADLEESYNKLLQNSKTTEIALHKQIHEHKSKETTLRQDIKKEKKQLRQQLSLLAQFINNNTKYYLMANNVNEQVEEIKKLHEKTLKKKTEQTSREFEYIQNQNKKIKLKNEQLEQTLEEIQKKEKIDSLKLVRNLSERDTGQVEGLEKLEKKSEANSSFINKSTDKSEDERYRSVKDKYESRLQLLRKDLKGKQSRINDLEKLQQVEFQKSKEKILELQLSVSQKVNEIRKWQMRLKEKDYEIVEVKNLVKQAEAKVTYLNDKFEVDKESSAKLLETKVQSYQEKLKSLKNNFKELEKKEQQKTFKYNKLKNKYEKYEVQASESLKRKNTQIDQLLKENNRLKTQNKLLEEKININTIISTEASQVKTPENQVNQDLIHQIEMERDRICSELTAKQKEYTELIELNSKMSSQILIIKKELRQSTTKFEEMQRDYRQLDQENKFAKEKIVQLSQQMEESAQENNSIFKKQLEKSLTAIKKLEKACEKYKEEREELNKEIMSLKDDVASYKSTTEKLKNKNISLSNEILDETEKNKRMALEYQIKLSEFQTKENQLVDIINYKNRQGENIRESMKGEELFLESAVKFTADKETSTRNLFIFYDISMNTSHVEEAIKKEVNQKPIIPSEIHLLQEEDLLEDPLEVQKAEKERKEEKVGPAAEGVNYFTDLVEQNQNLQDNFDICEEGQQINIGQTALNLQIKDVFNTLRKQIQKIFNQEDISIDVMKYLPKQLEDDFNDFTSYVKEKIFQIKNQNNLSFIMAEVGSEPQEVDQHIAQFLAKESQEYMRLRKIIEEKQYMISSLMNQKTEQENTINQMTIEKEEMEEETQNRFMNQCNLYKQQIKDSQKLIDILSMNFQSLKNIYKNTFQFCTETNDNYEDIHDNMVLYFTICKSDDKEKKKLARCLENYKKLRERIR